MATKKSVLKWSKLEPFAESHSVEHIFKRKGDPISVQVVKTHRGDAIRIFYKTELPKDACQYEQNCTQYKYDFIYKEDDPKLFNALKKILKEAAG